jgi:hypothetical protein
MRFRPFLVLAAGAAVGTAACGGNKDRAGGDTAGDTIAVPAAAVDTAAPTPQDSTGATVTTGAPGAGTAASGTRAEKAEGVDTPITKKLRAKDSAQKTADTAKRP